jgi:uncharacterized membrane protein HdeD (DUF308 family)
MSMDVGPELDQLRRTVSEAIHDHWKMFLAQGIVMMLLGLLAVALPNLSTLAVTILVGWLFLFGGLLRLMATLRGPHLPGYGWSILTAALAMILGLLLVLRPFEGILTLTMLLIVIFVLEGLGKLLVAFEFRRHIAQWGWTLFSGLVDLVLAFLIALGWPSSAAWAVGLLVGVNFFFFGLSLTMTSIAARAMAPQL